MLSLVLAVAVAQSPVEVTEQADATARAQPRLRAGLSLLVGAYTGPFNSGGVLVQPTIGISGELGVRLDDRVALIGRITGVLGLVNVNLGLGGLLEYAISDHFAVAGGPTLHLFFGYSVTPSLVATFPLRLTWAPSVRLPGEIARRSLLLGLEGAVGVIFFSAPGGGRDSSPIPVPSPWGSAQITFGFAWW